MEYIYFFVSVFIAWIWVDYFRLIDLFDREDLSHFIAVFFFGACSVLLIFPFQLGILNPSGWALNGNTLNDLLYCIFGIGLPEECAKACGFALFWLIFRKAVNEPIDVIAYVSVSALGFSAAENILYFIEHGPDIISGRAVLATVGHMTYTAFFAWGLVLVMYRSALALLHIPLFLLLSAISHGIYDFIIMGNILPAPWDSAALCLYFMMAVNVFAVILNNSINLSPYFSYARVVSPWKVSIRLMAYYLAVFAIQFGILSYRSGFMSALIAAVSSIYLTGFVIIVTILRLSRFRLIKDRLFPLRPELPFSLQTSEDGNGVSKRIVVKGDSYDETAISNYYGDFMMVHPVRPEDSFIENGRLAYIEEKYFLKNDESYFLIRIYRNDEETDFLKMLIKPKRSGMNMIRNRYPVAALFDLNGADLNNSSLDQANFTFKEWIYIRPRQYFR